MRIPVFDERGAGAPRPPRREARRQSRGVSPREDPKRAERLAAWRALHVPLGGPRSSAQGLPGLRVPPPVLENGDALAEDRQAVSVVESVMPAVVSIAITKDVSKIQQPQFVDPFSGEPLAPP